MPSYDDPRYFYDEESPLITYDGTYLYPARTGAQPAGTGQVTRHRLYRRTVTGQQPAGTSEITADALHQGHLQGTQPAATGTLSLEFFQTVQLTGAEPAPSGVLSTHRTYRVQLQGTQPAAAGQVVRDRLYRRTLVGQQRSGQAGGIVHQRGHYRRLLIGSQPETLGVLAGRYFHIIHVTLTGHQIVGTSINYDEPGVTYDDPGFLYEDQDAGQLVWRARFFRRLLGVQPPASSTEIVWKLNPYVWAQYVLSITDRPEVVQYQFDLQASDHVIAYDVDDEKLHDPVVYKVSGVKVYSHPPPGVRDLP